MCFRQALPKLRVLTLDWCYVLLPLFENFQVFLGKDAGLHTCLLCVVLGVLGFGSCLLYFGFRLRESGCGLFVYSVRLGLPI